MICNIFYSAWWCTAFFNSNKQTQSQSHNNRFLREKNSNITNDNTKIPPLPKTSISTQLLDDITTTAANTYLKLTPNILPTPSSLLTSYLSSTRMLATSTSAPASSPSSKTTTTVTGTNLNIYIYGNEINGIGYHIYDNISPLETSQTLYYGGGYCGMIKGKTST